MRTDLFIDPFNYLISKQQSIIDFVNEKLSQLSNLKVGVIIAVKLVKPLTNDDVTAFFNSHFMRLADHITYEEYHVHIDQLWSNLSVYAFSGSDWVIDSLLSIEVKTATCQMACESSYIATSTILKGLSRSLLNIKNKKDNFCFLCCVAAAIFSFTGRPSHPSSHKENVRRLKFNSARMPMHLSSIPTFERSKDVSINVYQLEGRKLVAVYYSKRKSSKRRINLLRLVEGSNSHYCLITNFSNLLHRLTRSESKRKKGSKSKFCSNSFHLSTRKISENFSSFVSQILHSKFVCRRVLLLSSLSIGRKHRGFPFLFMPIWKQLMSLRIYLPLWEATLKELKSSFPVVSVLFSSTTEVSSSILGFSASKIFVSQKPF